MAMDRGEGSGELQPGLGVPSLLFPTGYGILGLERLVANAAGGRRMAQLLGA